MNCPWIILLCMLLRVEAHDPQPPNPMIIPALGRPFVIGALYDVAHDHIVLGFSPWNLDTVEERTFDKDMPNVKAFKMTQERFSDKAVAFGISAEGKANFVAGLCSVSGSASFLYAKAARTYEAAVTFFYHKSTHLRQMTMEAIMEPDFPKMFQENPQIKATHVVTGIEYGANALFRISQKAKDYVEKMAFRGVIKVGMDDGFGGDLGLNISVEEHIDLNETSCEYLGDVILPKPPITFQDAIYAYDNISDLINKTTAAAMKVHLSPLDMINGNRREVRRISDYLLSSISDRQEKYDLMGISVGDLKDTGTYKNLKSFQNHINSVREALNIHKGRFKRHLNGLLPSIRLGIRLEDDLARVLDETGDWFGVKQLQDYITRKEKEGGALEEATTCCLNALIKKPGQFEQIRYNTSVTYLLAFTLYLYNQNDTFTECIKHNCISEKTVQNSRALCKGMNCFNEKDYKSWMNHGNLSADLRREFKRFRRVYEQNVNTSILRHGQVMVAIIRSCAKGKNQSTFALEVYVKGALKEKNLPLPNIYHLEKVNETVEHGFAVSWKVDMPPAMKKWFLNKYFIQYHNKGWQKVMNKTVRGDTQVNITSLCEVQVRVSLICKFGYCGYVTNKFEAINGDDDSCNERMFDAAERAKRKREAELEKMQKWERERDYNRSRLVMVGGMDDEARFQKSILIYRPLDGSNEGTSVALKYGRCGHIAEALHSGQILVAGGFLMKEKQKIKLHSKMKSMQGNDPSGGQKFKHAQSHITRADFHLCMHRFYGF